MALSKTLQQAWWFRLRMTFVPDGKIYVSIFGTAPSGGQIVQIDVP